MRYSNEVIEKLIKERDALIEKYNREIERQIEIEKSHYKFDWKAFVITIIIPFAVYYAIKLNEFLFTPDSVLSWDYWF